MNNFNKFLAKGEVLHSVFESRNSSFRVYFIILLFLPLFFVLFPMWKIGYQGVSLWFIALFLLVFFLAREIIGQNYKYLLTSKRLIHLRAVSQSDYKLLGTIKLDSITDVYQQGNKICVLSGGKKYYLLSIKSTDKLYQRLNSYIKSQNLV